ncbi:MAG: YdcF family protein [Bacteriovoracaceae bacterium]|nr:YdcF family protein [Bacteriovoracaceae bacterium]
MYSFLKTYVISLFSPTAMVGLLFIFSLVFYKFKKIRAAKLSVLSGFILFALMSTNPLTEWLLHSYEGIYPGFSKEALAIPAKDIKYVVVLGGGVASSNTQPQTSQLGWFTLTRLIEGIRIAQEIPHTKLVLSGGGWDEKTEAQLMAKVAVSIGFAQDRIILEEKSVSTITEVIELKTLLEGSNFVLVTSAIHMHRSMLLFKASGLKPIAAPTAHLLTGDYTFWNNKPLYARGDNLFAMDLLFYEFFGLGWGKLKGDL